MQAHNNSNNNIKQKKKKLGGKSTTSNNPLNQALIDVLLTFKNQAGYRANPNVLKAYNKAISSVSKFPLPITQIFQLRKLDGIGDFISKRIESKFDKIIQDQNNIITHQEEEKKLNEEEKIVPPRRVQEKKEHQKKQKVQLGFGLLSKESLILLSIYATSMQNNHQIKKERVMDIAHNLFLSLIKHAISIEKQKELLCLKDIQQSDQRVFLQNILQNTSKHANSTEWYRVITQLKRNAYVEVIGKDVVFLTQKGSDRVAQSMEKYYYKVKNCCNQQNQIEIQFVGQGDDDPCEIEEEKQVGKYNSMKKFNKVQREYLDLMERRFDVVQSSNRLESYTCIDEQEILQVCNDNQQSIPSKVSYDNQCDQHDYEILLLVDNRQVRTQKDRDYILNNLKNKFINVEKRPLALGDFLWIARHLQTKQEYVLDFIIERKTLDDLAASILDGRYYQQKERIQKSGIRNKIYLIEGQSQQSSQSQHQLLGTKMPRKNLLTAARHTQIHNSFSVIFSNGMKQTLNTLAKMNKIINKMYQGGGDENDFNDYADVINWRVIQQKQCRYQVFEERLCKSMNKTIEQFFGQQLRMIEGSNSKNAQSISSIFGTPCKLFTCYQKCMDQSQRMNLPLAAKYLFEQGVDAKENMTIDKVIEYSVGPMLRILKDQQVSQSSQTFKSAIPSNKFCKTLMQMYWEEGN